MTSLNKESGETFVIVTHAEEVGDMADRIVRMKDGIVIDDGLGNKVEDLPKAASIS